MNVIWKFGFAGSCTAEIQSDPILVSAEMDSGLLYQAMSILVLIMMNAQIGISAH